jgi:hypothetical protein
VNDEGRADGMTPAEQRAAVRIERVRQHIAHMRSVIAAGRETLEHRAAEANDEATAAAKDADGELGPELP